MTDDNDKNGQKFEDLLKSLGFKEVTPEELAAEGVDLSELASSLSSAPSRLCGCGTLHEAYEAGTKHAVQMMAADCPVWAFQVGTMIVMNALKLLAVGVPEDQHRETIAATTLMMNMEFQKSSPSAEVLETMCLEKAKEMGR